MEFSGSLEHFECFVSRVGAMLHGLAGNRIA